MNSRRSPHTSPAGRRGFTLIEALLASSILLGIVTAVTSAVLAGQQHAFEAQQQIMATYAAESLLARVSMVESTDDVIAWDGFTEAVGEMLDDAGDPMPPLYASLGRRVDVVAESVSLKTPDVSVPGQTVGVECFDASGRVIVRVERFMLEPES